MNFGVLDFPENFVPDAAPFRCEAVLGDKPLFKLSVVKNELPAIQIPLKF
jgi:hypothetical protein